MTKKEFEEKITKLGRRKEVYIEVTDFVKKPNAVACLFDKKNHKWIVYQNDSKGEHTELYSSSSENEAFNYLYNLMTS